MSFSNLQLMRETRQMLAPHWGVGVLVAFVYLLILGGPSSALDEVWEVVPLLFTGPLSLGFALFSLAIVREGQPHFNQLFLGFQSYLKTFLAYFMMLILIVVGLVFFIVPGIVISLAFSMTFFIMADQPELSFSECLYESWILTKGSRLKYLGLCLRFIPWYFLGVLALGVGVFLVLPWHEATNARFYEEIKRQKSMT